MSLYQLFPSNTIDDMDQFIISDWSKFDVTNFFPFVPIKRPYTSINDNSIYFIGLLEDVSLLNKACERLIREAIHAPSRRRKSHQDGMSTTWSPPNWIDVDKKLLKPMHSGHKYAQLKMTKTGKCRKGNADIRLAFNWNDLYAVKAHFTFGLRRPNEDEYHLITTTSSPILYYLPKPHKRLNVQYYFKEGVFAPHHEADFERHILEANSTFIIPPHTQYVIITVQETVFSFVKCSAKVLNELREPNQEKFASLNIKKPKLYVSPQPHTPTQVPRIWYPDISMNIQHPYEINHEDDWTLNSILPTLVDTIPSTSNPDEQFQNELQNLMAERLNAS